MAERATGKAKKASQRVSTGPPHAETREGAVGAVSTTGLVAGDEGARERDRLKAELAAAHARIAELEAQRDQIANRIDWIIDSLSSLLEEER